MSYFSQLVDQWDEDGTSWWLSENWDNPMVNPEGPWGDSTDVLPEGRDVVTPQWFNTAQF